MAGFKRQRDLEKQMCGWVVPALVESRAKDESGENQPPLAHHRAGERAESQDAACVISFINKWQRH